MPVKTNMNTCSYFDLPHSPAFDCSDIRITDEIHDGQADGDASSGASSCEDIWMQFDDFLLTPPQSPPSLRFDLVSDFVDNNGDAGVIGISGDSLGGHNMDVLHDCMWSGQCQEDWTHKHSMSCTNTGMSRACNMTRPDTPVNHMLSSSPFNLNYTFDHLLPSCDSSNDEESMSCIDDEDDYDFYSSSSQDSSSSTNCSPMSSPSHVKRVLINDHSYDCSMNNMNTSHSQKKASHCEWQSLIYPSPTSSSSSMKKKAQSRPRVKCPKMSATRIKIIRANKETTTTTPKVSASGRSIQLVNTDNSKNQQQHSSCKKNSKNSMSLFSRNNKFNGDDNSKSKTKIQQQVNSKKDCKFSTRKKATTVTQEKNIMLAQRSLHHNVIIGSSTSSHAHKCKSDEDDDYEDSKSSMHSSNKQVPPVRRREHNDSERKRRDHLRNAFLDLKDQIPKLKSSDKGPARIKILSEATAYVFHLNDKQRYLERTRDAEFAKREQLLKQLSALQNGGDGQNEDDGHEN